MGGTMRVPVAMALCMCLCLFECRGIVPDASKCDDCLSMLEVLEAHIKSPEGEGLDSNEVVVATCGTFSGNKRVYCFDLLTVDAPDFVEAIQEKADQRQICVEAAQCANETSTDNPSAVSSTDASATTTATATDVIPHGDDTNTSSDTEEVAFHHAGTDTVDDVLLQAKTLQTTDNTKADDAAAAGVTSGGGKKRGGAGGLAWDKHDFDVTNNHGGDVKVEVNLAAPGVGATEGGTEDLAEVIGLIANMTQQQQQQPDETTDLLKQIKDMVAVQEQQPPEPSMDAEVMKQIMQTIKELNQPPPAPPPVPPPQQNIASIIEALHPPPSPAQPPIDIASLMREMRQAIEAGRPPPAAPPGVDSSLMKSLMDMMKDMKDLHQSMADNIKDMASKNSQSASAAPVSPPPVAPIFPVPDINWGEKHADLESKYADMQSRLDKLTRPFPDIPKPPSNDAIAELKKMMMQHVEKSSQPVILPAPKTPPPAPMLAPPPPPMPSSHADMMDKLEKLMRNSKQTPQRIPAPPSIIVERPPTGCCNIPAPEDPDNVKCPRVNGKALPRCKRKRPSALPLKCKAHKCTTPEALDAADEATMGKRLRGTPSNVDEDGDEVLDVWDAAARDVLNDFPGMTPDDFNPKQLLHALCPGGKCDPVGYGPGHKTLPHVFKPQSHP